MTAEERAAVISAANQAIAVETLIGWAADASGKPDAEPAVRAIERLVGDLREQLRRIADG